MFGSLFAFNVKFPQLHLGSISSIKLGSKQLTSWLQVIKQTPGFKMWLTDVLYPCFFPELVMLWSIFPQVLSYNKHLANFLRLVPGKRHKFSVSIQ